MTKEKVKIGTVSDDVTSAKWYFIYAGVILMNIGYILIFLYITGIYDK